MIVLSAYLNSSLLTHSNPTVIITPDVLPALTVFPNEDSVLWQLPFDA